MFGFAQCVRLSCAYKRCRRGERLSSHKCEWEGVNSKKGAFSVCMCFGNKSDVNQTSVICKLCGKVLREETTADVTPTILSFYLTFIREGFPSAGYIRREKC